jgi:predicted transcriptional regulator
MQLRDAATCGMLKAAPRRKQPMERVSVTCRIEPDDLVFLDKLAEAMERDRSFLIKKAIGDFIARQKWQVEEVELARAEAVAGQVLTEKELDSDMKKW